MSIQNNQAQNLGYTQGQYVWWTGTVLNVEDDPDKNGRIRVRIHGWYDNVEEKKIPWCIPLGSARSESHKGVGFSPTGIQKGSIAIGFFLDGADAQVPIYVGTLYGMPDNLQDTHWRAREKEERNKFTKLELLKGRKPGGGLFEEPKPQYRAKYPYNHVHFTKNKHLFELDDTEGQQRYRYRHPTKSEFEWDREGTLVIHGVKDSWQMIKGDMYIHMDRNMFISCGDGFNLNVMGNAKIQVNGNVDYKVGGNYNLDIGGSLNIKTGGTTNITAGGACNIKASVINLN